MPDNDTPIELKKRARRRLVGAAALALFAAIVLPMIMDQEPKPANSDIQIRIPRPEQGAPLPRALPPGGREQVAAAPPPPAGAERALDAAPAGAKPEPQKPSSTQDEAPKPSGAKAAKDKPGVTPDAQVKEVPKASDKPAVTKADEAPAASAEAGRWVVQLGAFRDPANAKHLRAKLKSEGYASFTEPLASPGGNKTRVRAGPFANREAAEKARDRLKRIGLDGVVAQQQ